MPQPQVIALDHLVLTVASIPATVAFYKEVLGMQAKQFDTADGETRWALKFGAAKINLHQAGAEFEPKAAQATAGSADLCFLTETPLSEWMAHLSKMGVAIEKGPVSRTGARFPLTSIYVRDPDQNLIEIAVRR
ncbi:VOC family protein [Sulfitobacter sp. JBTF-M27]|uniref:VOC family protein n=1 Tax=Sulfitobacter sediminilitoris TaxID=2698830 RepID=A0A6P0C9N7_9RHOB|nr:VOC family protein [Sulfitobacter sediminilitoris]NEK21816.1 VOC family protein [Sulfitobacter sediminilitoris]